MSFPLISITRLAATWSGSAADPSYPASNLDLVRRPDAPAKTTTTGAQFFDADLGATKNIVAVHLGCVNVATATVLADDAPTFNSDGGNPQHASGILTVGTNGGNGRRCRLYMPGSILPRRYVRVGIPSQTTLDGTSVYRLGYIWIVEAGDLTTWPAGLRYGGDPSPIDPFDDLINSSQRRQRISRGPEFMRFAGEEFADLDRTLPFQADSARVTMDLERRWAAADFALIALGGASDTSWVGVMRQVVRARWRLDAAQATAAIEWEEVTGP